MLKLRIVFALVFLVSNSFAAHFQDRLKQHPPTDVLTYWDYYMSFSDLKELNSAYVATDAVLGTPRLRALNDMAFVKCISERSLLDKSHEMLRRQKNVIARGDRYLKGVYCLVKARLLFRVDRMDDALVCNARAIQYLKDGKHTGELKNALLNQGYFYSAKSPEKAMNYYAQAKKLEESGEKRFFVLLRTNLALQFLLKNDTQKATMYCSEALNYLTKSGKEDYLDLFRVYIIQASIAEKNNDVKAEDAYLEKAKLLAKKHQMYLNITSIVQAQSYNYYQRSDYKNAYSSLLEKDSLNKVMNVENLSEQMVVFDLETKIAASKAEKRRLNTQFRHERERKQWLLLSALFLAGLVIVITYLWLGNRRKINILIQQNKELVTTDAPGPRVKAVPQRSADALLIAELEKWVFDKELYKQSNLTIERLAKKLNTNRTYLSEAINIHYQTGYSAWINQVRIHAARKLLVDSEHSYYSIEGIAQLVGYTSISSFNSSFKRITGLTPSQFRNKVK